MLNPATPLAVLDHTLDALDLVLVMSVNPGFGGQPFIPGALDKLRRIRPLIDASGRDIRLEVDGGVKLDNIGRSRRRAPTPSSPAARSSAPGFAAAIRAMQARIGRASPREASARRSFRRPEPSGLTARPRRARPEIAPPTVAGSGQNE